MVSDYTVTYDEEENILVKCSVTSYCPICGGALSYRDTCERIMLLEGRERRNYIIRRLKCCHCGRLHRELPDCLAPYKHYAAEVISGTLDGVITSEDEDYADYPCVATMKRWHHWLIANNLRVEECLKSAGCRLLGFGERYLKTGMTLLEKMRSSNVGWLEAILCFIYNSGGSLSDY